MARFQTFTVGFARDDGYRIRGILGKTVTINNNDGTSNLYVGVDQPPTSKDDYIELDTGESLTMENYDHDELKIIGNAGAVDVRLIIKGSIGGAAFG